jgi:hypothetical protein
MASARSVQPQLSRGGDARHDLQVVVAYAAHPVMHGDLMHPLRVGERVEPQLLDPRIPGAQERLAQDRAPRDGDGRAGDDDAWVAHAMGLCRPRAACALS